MLRVEHDCEIITEHEDIVFLSIYSFYEKMFNALRRFMMASTRNPGARKHLRSRVSIVAEKRRHLRNYKHIIHPFSMFRHCWDFTMILTMMLLLLTVPYYAVFEARKRLYYWTALKNSLLLFCCIDIVINFMTGYFDKSQNIVVMEPKKIMNRYVRQGTFLPDLFGSLITDTAFFKVGEEYRFIQEMASLICVFRVFSLNFYMSKIADEYDISLATYEICVIVFWILLALHWQSCLYWLVPITTTSFYWPGRPADNFWLHEFGLWEQSKVKQYLSCLVRAVSVFLSAGYLRSKPETEEDLTLVVILQVLGILTIWILTARVKLFFKGVNSSRIRYQGNIAELKQYMRTRQLSHSQQSRIVSYYEFRFQRQYFRETEILNTLSGQMRQEIRMHACRKLVENVTFFNNLPLSLLSRIVALLKSEIFLTNDVIVRANQLGDCMYFIATGTVAIYTSSGKEVCHLEDGAHFGEIALVMPDERRVASVVAIETCELYRLDRGNFVRTIHPYPMLWERIKKIAIERHEKTIILNMQ
ncbi:hypothetical protein DMN91_004532 [Ooceraea biroi]|uniref:Cyclic nucleotide-binding domain-containing protein n=1 Tax=Ooceraea biroi TaxID=2015173 RepID=A0A3L8DP94_OOCBI|nr:potassium/sodium hyperpolarization-activated cyclic nucleotide-gated channel 2 [Ooceraea biroi]RLU22254.1 hypothetical protein DMN91_004532 [Ooceraea biroi]